MLQGGSHCRRPGFERGPIQTAPRIKKPGDAAHYFSLSVHYTGM